MIVLFVFYVNSISVAANVAEITSYRSYFVEKDLGVGTWKKIILENSWKLPGILLSSVSEHRVGMTCSQELLLHSSAVTLQKPEISIGSGYFVHKEFSLF